MSEINFGADQVAEVVTEEVPGTVVVLAPSIPERAAEMPLARQSSMPNFKDVIFPHLNLVHPLSKTADAYPVGSITFAESVMLFTPSLINKDTGNVERKGTPPVNITVIEFKPQRFVEKVSEGNGLIVDTEQEVVANGGTLDWSEWDLKKASGMKLFQVLAEAIIAIERPAHIADDDTVFVYRVGDKKYTLAVWSLKGSAYTEAAKRCLFWHRMSGCLLGGYPTHNFSLSTRFKAFKTNHSSWVPVIVPCLKSTPEFLTFASGILGQV